MSLGDFDASAIIYDKFTTYRPSTGAPFTLAGTPALSVYKDNSTTQSTSGVTLSADFDSVTGFNHYAIDTSSDGTFYSAGSFFQVVITTGTVDSVSAVGTVVGRFSIRKNSALKPTTAGRTLVVDASGLADANTVKLGPTGAGTAQTARDIGTSVLLSSGTGTGQLSLSSGLVTLAAVTHTGAVIPTVTTTTTATNLTNAPTAGDFTATMKTSIGTAVAASAVASVTGNVSGNVVGSVGSVTGGATSANQTTINNNVLALGSPMQAGASVTLTAAYDAAKTAAQAGNAMALTSGERDSTADALLARNVSGGSSAGRTVKQALHVLRNKTAIAAGTLTVYDTDDTTSSFTATVTTAAGDPITSIDPA